MNNINYFMNERMKTLLVLRDHQIDTGDQLVCPLNQIEIASFVGCSKVKVNQILKELTDSGYVNVQKKGRYILTESANAIITKLELGEKK